MKIKHCSNGEDTLIIESNDLMHPLKCMNAKLIVKKFGSKPKQSSIPFFHKKDKEWVEDYDEWFDRVVGEES
ncbi:MAG: hypothetical protein IKQ61_05730 [Spirochaetales bacterium]|nr:hypothetical protein [Spirochaetales bacterium]MBR6199746.1 hypothetical protein [Spirochaetales bacterium]